jgi:protein-S-isoprenylcysteine O-methyltransferase Ste14
MGLGLMIVYVVVALGWRSLRHLRTHGDLGWRLSATTPTGRAAGLVMTAAQAGLGVVVVATGLGTIQPTRAVVASVLFCLGLTVVAQAQRTMGASWRVGTDPQERTALVVDGWFRRVRNPIFSGMTLCLGGIALTTGSWVAGLMVGAFVLGAELQVRLVEEPYLRRLHGRAFASYEERTGRFIPRFVAAA